MKLQLTPTQAAIFASKTVDDDGNVVAGGVSDIAADVANVLTVFAAEGHDPFTRRDVTAVLEAIGYSKDLLGTQQAWEDIGTSITAVAKGTKLPNGKARRGYYTQGSRVGSSDLSMTQRPDPGAYQPPTGAINVAPGSTVEVIAKAGISWVPTALGASDLEGFYADDPGLRRMGAVESNCFGVAFLVTDLNCKVCPLARFCAQSSTSSLTAIAARLDAETEGRINSAFLAARSPSPTATPPPGGHVDPVPLGEYHHDEWENSSYEAADYDPVDAQLTRKFGDEEVGWTRVPMPFDGVCSADCDEPTIKAKTHSIHIKGDGMYHEACALAV